jgi:hypothetical protein
MTKTYYRPLGLCYGSDAEHLLPALQASGGKHDWFYTVERIARDGKSISIPSTDAACN